MRKKRRWYETPDRDWYITYTHGGWVVEFWWDHHYHG